MPVLFNNNLVCHFAHIPKCAGSSVTRYCENEGFRIGFIDRSFIASPAKVKWSISSPQHIDGYSLSRIFPKSFFDFGFAVVRHPKSRLVSAFKHQMTQNLIPRDASLNDFIKNDLEAVCLQIGLYDNHFLPQTKFLIPELQYQVFQLENNLDSVRDFLNSKFRNISLDSKILHYNEDRMTNIIKPSQLEIDKYSLDLLREIYSDDFIKLGY